MFGFYSLALRVLYCFFLLMVDSSWVYVSSHRKRLWGHQLEKKLGEKWSQWAKIWDDGFCHQHEHVLHRPYLEVHRSVIPQENTAVMATLLRWFPFQGGWTKYCTYRLVWFSRIPEGLRSSTSWNTQYRECPTYQHSGFPKLACLWVSGMHFPLEIMFKGG